MSEQPKKDDNSSQNENKTGQTPKLQRKLKFKTLDGQVKDVVCDFDIKIGELKKILEKIYNKEPIRQRLLFKGKQLKDDECLDKLVDKDDTIIHLVFRSEEDVLRSQNNQNSQNNNNNQSNNQNRNQNQQNIDLCFL